MRDGGVETRAGYISRRKTKSMTIMDVSLTLDFRGKEESNNLICIYLEAELFD